VSLASTEELYRIADELRGVANLGLNFAANEYDKERYERVLSASARLIATIEHRSPNEVLTQFRDNLHHISPLAGAEAAVFRSGKLLLIRRRDDGLWALPGGLTEVGETLAESAQRELWEETGVRGRVTQLLGIFDSRVWHTPIKSQLYHAVFLAESDDVPTPGPEALDVAFFGESDLPNLSPGHHLRVPVIFKLLRGEMLAPYFDNFGLTSRIDPRVEMRPSPIGGKGIFANAPIQRGEVIIV
jgi:ADP-ribose pyrophosphatase YjhB (NUDIX family)